jgi:hypothetical protein
VTVATVLIAVVGLGAARQARLHGDEVRRTGGPPASAASAPAQSSTEPASTTSIEPTPAHHAQPPWTMPTWVRLSTPLFTPIDRAALYEATLAWADCMWAHGIPDFPEPSPNFGDGRTHTFLLWGPPGSDMDQRSTAFIQASGACRAFEHASDVRQGKAYEDQSTGQTSRPAGQLGQTAR